MDRHLSLAVLGMLLTACVTVNVYFPASAAERAADIFIKDVYGTEPEGTQTAPDENSGAEPTGQSDQFPNDSFGWRNVLDWFVTPAQAQQPDINIATPGINTLKRAMETRHRDLLPFYESGGIGMANNGLLTIRDPQAIGLKQRNQVKKLIADENRDRNQLYGEIAKANGHPEWEPDIRSIFAQRWVGNAPGGWWFQTAGGGWQQK